MHVQMQLPLHSHGGKAIQEQVQTGGVQGSPPVQLIRAQMTHGSVLMQFTSPGPGVVQGGGVVVPVLVVVEQGLPEVVVVAPW
jgi:hypothetical protein